MKWIKMLTDLPLTDARLNRLPHRARYTFVQLYALAGKCEAGGSLSTKGKPMTDAEIQFHLRAKKVELQADLRMLKTARLIGANGHGYFICDWQHEQSDIDEVRAGSRARQAKHRSANVTRDTPVTDEPSQPGNAPRPDQTRPRPEPDLDPDLESDQPTTLPSSPEVKSDGKGRQAGNRHKRKISDGLDATLTQDQEQRARLIAPILTASGLRDPLLKETSNIVATRSSIETNDLATYVLAALASSYADDKAKNPLTVAAYRIEKDRIPPAFTDPSLWHTLPQAVLDAAGIEDLDAYIRRQKYGSLSGED